MMKKIKIFTLFISALMLSCATYLDNHQETIDIQNGYIVSLKEKNILHYENNILQNVGNKKILNPTFKIVLPKNIIKLNVLNAREFLIKFNDNQYIYLEINNNEQYINSKFYEKKFSKIQKDLMFDSKNIIRDNNVKNLNSRADYIIFNNYAKIYLFNIKFDSKERFINSGRSLKFGKGSD